MFVFAVVTVKRFGNGGLVLFCRHIAFFTQVLLASLVLADII